ncbi:MAG: hypothetical protein QXF45_04790 [Candidatus Caldarchaeum sp.]
MQPLFVFALVLVSSFAGFYVFNGRQISFRNISPTISLSSLFLFSIAVFQAAAQSSSLEVLIAIVAVAAILNPLASNVVQRSGQPGILNVFIRILYFYLLTAAVIRALQEIGLNPILIAGYGITMLVYARASPKIGWTATQGLNTLVAIASLYAATALTIPPEILPVFTLVLLLALSTAPKAFLEKSDAAIVVILSAALIFVFLGVFLSPFADAEKPLNVEIGLNVFAVLAVVFASVGLSGEKPAASLSDTFLFAAASALAFAGPSFHQSLATLLTPLTGLPSINLTTQISLYMMQFFGLATLFALLNKIVEYAATIQNKLIQKSSFTNQVFAVGAVAFAVFASISTDLATLLSLAGSTSLAFVSALLPTMTRNKLVLFPCFALFLVAANLVMLNVLTETEASLLITTGNVPKIISSAFAVSATVTAAWLLAGNVSNLLRRKAF